MRARQRARQATRYKLFRIIRYTYPTSSGSTYNWIISHAQTHIGYLHRYTWYPGQTLDFYSFKKVPLADVDEALPDLLNVDGDVRVDVRDPRIDHRQNCPILHPHADGDALRQVVRQHHRQDDVTLLES